MLFSSLTARLARRPVTAQHHSFPPDRSPGSQQLKILTTTWLMLLTPQLCSCHFPAKKTSLGFPLLSIKWSTPSSSQNEGFFSKWAFCRGVAWHSLHMLFQAWWVLYLFFNFWAFPDHLSLAVSTLSPSSVASPTCRASLRCLPTSLRPYHTWG